MARLARCEALRLTSFAAMPVLLGELLEIRGGLFYPILPE